MDERLVATLTQQFFNALTIGGIYALIALGYTMVYGIIELINFAHGEIFMVGAFIAMTFLVTLGFTARSPIRWCCSLVLGDRFPRRRCRSPAWSASPSNASPTDRCATRHASHH